MRGLSTVLMSMLLCLVFAGSAMAYTITDDATGGDCTQIGIWNAGTKTCTLTGDIAATDMGVYIATNQIVLDGNSHILNGTGEYNSNGVYIESATGVVVKNLTINRFFHGIVLGGVSSSLISNNMILSGNSGILAGSSSGNIISNNTIAGFGYGLNFTYGGGNSIYNNNFMSNNTHVLLNQSSNTLNLSAPTGGNYYDDFDTQGEGCYDTNNDGICDSAHYLVGGVDDLPWIMQNGWIDADGDGYPKAVDCNDNNANEHPGQTWYKDADNDGYSDGTTSIACARPSGYKLAFELTATSGDCNDGSASIYPGAMEIKLDGIDQDCNGYDLTINITKAVYRTSNDQLTVEATSSLGANATLQLVGYGAMTWKSSLSKWTVTIKPAGGNPGTATVSGTEGSTSLTVTVQ